MLTIRNKSELVRGRACARGVHTGNKGPGTIICINIDLKSLGLIGITRMSYFMQLIRCRLCKDHPTHLRRNL